MPQVRGDGHIDPLEDKPQSKCRRWRLRVSVGRDLATGKYPPASRNVRGTYSDAKKAMRDFIAELESDVAPSTKSDKFAEFATDWLESRKGKVAHGTWRKNNDHLQCLLMHLRSALLREITPTVLENVYAALMSGKSPSGRKLSGTYVSCVAGTMSVIMNAAKREGLITSNPCEDAKRPTNDTEERKAMSVEQMRLLIPQLDPCQPCELACLLMVKTGIRRGESIAIRLRHYRKGEKILQVRESVDNTGEPKSTKTKKGMRDLPLSDSACADIDRRIAYMEEKGLPTTPDSPLICNAVGEYILPNSVTRWWGRNRERLGFPDWTVYELRHSYLSELARRGVPPKVLQEIAGHESFSTTQRIYIHVGMEDKRDALQVVDW